LNFLYIEKRQREREKTRVAGDAKSMIPREQHTMEVIVQAQGKQSTIHVRRMDVRILHARDVLMYRPATGRQSKTK
jgi:hypothetical protein